MRLRPGSSGLQAWFLAQIPRSKKKSLALLVVKKILGALSCEKNALGDLGCQKNAFGALNCEKEIQNPKSKIKSQKSKFPDSQIPKSPNSKIPKFPNYQIPKSQNSQNSQ